MTRYTKKDADGRYYIESANGKLESNIKGYTYGEAIDRFAELENADVALKGEVDLYRKQVDELEDELASTYDKLENAKSEVIEEYRKKVYSKMEKYTVFGREYIQRIMREVEKEMKGGE